MVAANTAVALGCISAFLAATLGFVQVSQTLGARSQSMRVQKRVGSLGALDHVLQAGVPALAPLASKILAWDFARQQVSSVRQALGVRGVAAQEEGIVSLFALLSLAVGAIMFVTGKFAVAPVAIVALAGALVVWARRVRDKEVEDMRDKLPDAVRAMSSCFGVGFSLLQTFEHLAKETKGPLGVLFAQAAREMQMGASPDETLLHLRQRAGLEELSFVAVALAVQHQTGGSLQKVLDAAHESLKQESELRRSLRVHTAQAKLSAWVVCGVTIGLVLVMALLSESFLDPFFESIAGMTMLAVALGMQVAGIACVRALLRVEVS